MGLLGFGSKKDKKKSKHPSVLPSDDYDPYVPNISPAAALPTTNASSRVEPGKAEIQSGNRPKRTTSLPPPPHQPQGTSVATNSSPPMPTNYYSNGGGSFTMSPTAAARASSGLGVGSSLMDDILGELMSSPTDKPGAQSATSTSSTTGNLLSDFERDMSLTFALARKLDVNDTKPTSSSSTSASTRTASSVPPTTIAPTETLATSPRAATNPTMSRYAFQQNETPNPSIYSSFAGSSTANTLPGTSSFASLLNGVNNGSSNKSIATSATASTPASTLTPEKRTSAPIKRTAVLDSDVSDSDESDTSSSSIGSQKDMRMAKGARPIMARRNPQFQTKRKVEQWVTKAELAPNSEDQKAQLIDRMKDRHRQEFLNAAVMRGQAPQTAPAELPRFIGPGLMKSAGLVLPPNPMEVRAIGPGLISSAGLIPSSNAMLYGGIAPMGTSPIGMGMNAQMSYGMVTSPMGTSPLGGRMDYMPVDDYRDRDFDPRDTRDFREQREFRGRGDSRDRDFDRYERDDYRQDRDYDPRDYYESRDHYQAGGPYESKEQRDYDRRDRDFVEGDDWRSAPEDDYDDDGFDSQRQRDELQQDRSGATRGFKSATGSSKHSDSDDSGPTERNKMSRGRREVSRGRREPLVRDDMSVRSGYSAAINRKATTDDEPQPEQEHPSRSASRTTSPSPRSQTSKYDEFEILRAEGPESTNLENGNYPRSLAASSSRPVSIEYDQIREREERERERDREGERTRSRSQAPTSSRSRSQPTRLMDDDEPLAFERVNYSRSSSPQAVMYSDEGLSLERRGRENSPSAAAKFRSRSMVATRTPSPLNPPRYMDEELPLSALDPWRDPAPTQPPRSAGAVSNTESRDKTSRRNIDEEYERRREREQPNGSIENSGGNSNRSTDQRQLNGPTFRDQLALKSKAYSRSSAASESSSTSSNDRPLVDYQYGNRSGIQSSFPSSSSRRPQYPEYQDRNIPPMPPMPMQYHLQDRDMMTASPMPKASRSRSLHGGYQQDDTSSRGRSPSPTPTSISRYANRRSMNDRPDREFLDVDPYERQQRAPSPSRSSPGTARRSFSNPSMVNLEPTPTYKYPARPGERVYSHPPPPRSSTDYDRDPRVGDQMPTRLVDLSAQAPPKERVLLHMKSEQQLYSNSRRRAVEEENAKILQFHKVEAQRERFQREHSGSLTPQGTLIQQIPIQKPGYIAGGRHMMPQGGQSMGGPARQGGSGYRYYDD
ncbi:hypothetical protein BC936DRAFT_139174 [Jimgerdemannia flammicorona]|uniref:Uncharacterized protein n=1 Tax=Jimgerdemannia flammicorona TaxID=994334 RepID=A0A433DHT7_9FUNG|nr:hypothetical protein BC936DRAFT_139174 [Jimgerdemannia flammicorona]